MFSETGVVYAALAITLIIAMYALWKTVKKPVENGDVSYFTAKGGLDNKRLFFSIFATTFSAFTVVGLPAMFYAHGIGTFLWMGMGIALTPFVTYFIGNRVVEKASSSNSATVLGLLLQGYGSRALMIIMSVVTVVVLFPYLTLQISGLGKFLVSASDGGVSYLMGTIFVCAIVALYTSAGGAFADAETDYLQGIILLAGVIVLGALLLSKISTAETLGLLQEKKLLSLPGPKGLFTTQNLISFGIIFTLISISTPQVSQKLLGAKSKFQLNKVMWLLRG
jgi:solute:Na+ symporter, SSS family